MHKYIKILISFLIILLLVGGLYTFDTNNGSAASKPKETNVIIKWPKFYKEKYKTVRELILQDKKEAVQEINESSGIKQVGVLIAFEDINGDGVKEIIAGIQHPFFTGSRVNTSVSIYFYKKEDQSVEYFQPIWKANIFPDKNGNQDGLAIIERKGKTWDDFIINGMLIEYNEDDGRYYFTKKMKVEDIKKP